LRKIIRFLMYRVRIFLNFWIRITTTPDEKTVIFVSFNGRSYSDSPKAVYEHLLTRPDFQDYDFIWASSYPEQHAFLNEYPRTRIVNFKTKAYQKALYQSKYWICNFRVPDDVWPGPDNIYAQCWHGTPLKKLGYDIEKSDNAMNTKEELTVRYDRDALKFKYLLSPSAFATRTFISAWGLDKLHKEDTIMEIGYPRNDRLAQSGGDPEETDEVKTRLGLTSADIGEKKIILYAPTWRDNQHAAEIGYTYDLRIDFDKLKEAIGDEFVILFRVHYLVHSSFDFGAYPGFLYDFSEYDDINDLYIASDMLLTDYSSVMFDYANLNKPMLFYMYDLAEYGDTIRGFYFDPERVLPGEIVQTEDRLAGAIFDTSEPDLYREKYGDMYRAFAEKFTNLDDGKASERFVDTVFR
jgi:CDP-glycerol glycerophosphotransferase